MRKNETLEQEASRLKVKTELPGRIKSCTDRISILCATIKEQIAIKANSKSFQPSDVKNFGGELSGKLNCW